MPHKIKRFRKRWLFAGAAAVMLILAFLIWFGGLPLWRSKAFLAQLEPGLHTVPLKSRGICPATMSFTKMMTRIFAFCSSQTSTSAEAL